AAIVNRRGIGFDDFLDLRAKDPENRRRMPRSRVIVPGKAGEDRYFWDEEAEAKYLAEWVAANPAPPAPAEPQDAEDNQAQPAPLQPTRQELHEVRELERLFARLESLGLSMDDWSLIQEISASGEKMPTRYELITADSRNNPVVKSIANLQSVLSAI